MSNIKIGEHVFEHVAMTVSPNLLGMEFGTEMPLGTLAAVFDAEAAPEVRVLDMQGATIAMYVNHKLTCISLSTIGGSRRAAVTLQVTPVEAGGEGGADIAALQEEVNALKAALNAIEEGIAHA